MAIVLPKDKRFLIGFRFPELIPFELNNLNLSAVMSSLFRLAVLEGGDWTRKERPEETADIARSVVALTRHSRVHGLLEAGGQRVANRLTESTLILTSKSPRTRQMQITAAIPYTIASFKVGLPTNMAGFRQVDRLLYAMLVDQWDGKASGVRDFIEQTFGEGVDVQGAPTPAANRKRGDIPELDVLAELSLAYIDGFEAIIPRRGTSRPYVAARPAPGLQRRFGIHLRRFWTTYSPRQPRTLLIDQTITLIAFELTVLTIKLLDAIPALASNPHALPAAMTDAEAASGPEIYVDWVGDHRHLSRSLATACLRRDVGAIERFTRAVFDLRYLHEVVHQVRSDRMFRSTVNEYLGDEDARLETPQYIQGLLKLMEHPDLQAELRWGARSHLDAIIAANRPNSNSIGDDDDWGSLGTEAEQVARESQSMGKTPVEQVQELLFRAQGRATVAKNITWLRDAGGLNTSSGLMSGGANRRTWSYSPGNELLTVLVQLRAVDHPKWNPVKGAEPVAFGLADFLEWLEQRFGIIVDRPPAGLGFDGPEHATAARDNLQAMLRRLRQMGMFEDQSDDFTVQQITPPYVDTD